MKRRRGRFDTLLARYYPALYSFASRLTDDPRKAVLLTHEAFIPRESNFGIVAMRSSL
jgi:DNA-directed RNA polymerase specialized sigma24 family protein